MGAWLSYADLYAAVPTAASETAAAAFRTVTSETTVVAAPITTCETAPAPTPASVTCASRPTVSDVNCPGQTAWTVPDDTLAASAVTGDRNPSASSSSPSSRLGRDRIEKSGMAALQEALKTFAGVSIRDYGGIGGLKTVNIRNFGAQHTGISYDGVILTDAMNGQVDIGLFDLEAVSGITVKIAGNDDIYRSARLNSSVGTVEISTLRPLPGTRADVRLRAASFGTYEPYVRVSQGFGANWNASVSVGGLVSDGDYPFVLHNGNVTTHEIRLNSDVKSLKTEANVHGEMGKAGNLDVKIAGAMSERGLPGSVILYTQHPSERLWDKSLICSVIHDVSFRIPLKLKTSLSYNGMTRRV